VIRFLLGGLILAVAGLAAPAGDLAIGKDDAAPAPMRFEWRSEGPAGNCGDQCRNWISAVGAIKDDTARQFEAFARTHDVRGATLALDSQGGSVLGALALGRAIRTLDITTTVGKTALLSDGKDGLTRVALKPDGACESMCAFVLLGGVRRYVPAEARIRVHQIWLGNKRTRAAELSYSAEELVLVQRDIGRLAQYTIEMGGGIELIETSLRIAPWEPLYSLSAEEMRGMRLSTVDQLFAQAPPRERSASVAAPADVVTAPAQPASLTAATNSRVAGAE
jgi:hypothetical protein